MKIRKTREDEREVYKYSFQVRTENGGYETNTVVLKPGENGVRELDIKMLHSMDDSEVYYNLKNARPERTKEEKAEIEVGNKNLSATSKKDMDMNRISSS